MTTPLDPVIFFDFDGVLLDSEGPVLRVIADALAARGLGSSELHADRCRGRDLADVLSELEDAVEARLGEGFLTQVRTMTAGLVLEPMPGAAEVLGHLADAGRRVLVVTNSPTDAVLARADAAGLGRWVRSDTIVSGADTGRLKPDPGPYLRALDRAAVGPQGAVAVEDSLAGAASARAAGLDVCFFSPPPVSHPAPACCRWSTSEILRLADPLYLQLETVP